MTFELILIIALAILLFLTYQKLSTVAKALENKIETENESAEDRERKRIDFHNWLYEDLEAIKSTLAEMSDVMTVENPAWGESSATSKKKENLINLYASHLVEKEKMNRNDALLKSRFVLNNFENGVTESMLRDLNFKSKIQSEEAIFAADFFMKEVEAQSRELKAFEIFEPLWIGIKNKRYKKGETFLQNTENSFSSHDGDYGYDCYVKDAAVIHKLEKLKIFEIQEGEYTFDASQDLQTLGLEYEASAEEIKSAYMKLAKKYQSGVESDSRKFTEITTAYKNLNKKVKHKTTLTGHPFYTLKEDDLAKIRKVIFANESHNIEYFDDLYMEERHPKDKRVILPFKREFEIN